MMPKRYTVQERINYYKSLYEFQKEEKDKFFAAYLEEQKRTGKLELELRIAKNTIRQLQENLKNRA